MYSTSYIYIYNRNFKVRLVGLPKGEIIYLVTSSVHAVQSASAHTLTINLTNMSTALENDKAVSFKVSILFPRSHPEPEPGFITRLKAC
jgi:hypothetical protein